MDLDEVKTWIAEQQWRMLESAWMQDIEDADAPPADFAAVLEAVVQAEQLDTAETLGWALLADRIEKLPPEKALEFAKVVVSAVPDSDELRSQAADLYRKLYGDHEHFDAIFREAGLMGRQSPRRAFRTLDTCLVARAGAYLANRYDHRVVRLIGYDDALEEFELTEAGGKTTRMDPKELADEFDIAADNDFRVLCQHRPEELSDLIEKDPATVLSGICIANGGQINSAALKERLVPDYLPADKWSGWWNRARTAAKRCDVLALEGKHPIIVKHYPHGRSLEEEFSSALSQARTPLDYRAVGQQYVREARQRKRPIAPSFAQPLMTTLAQQASSFAKKRPSDALAAALAIDELAALGIDPPAETHLSPVEILASAKDPAEVVAHVGEPALWPAAMDALSDRPDAQEALELLLRSAPATLLDSVAGRLDESRRRQSLAALIGEAISDPNGGLEVLLWLWHGPAEPPPECPTKVELLTRLLNLMQALHRDWHGEAASAQGTGAKALRKQICQRIRGALAARDYAAFRAAVSQIDEAVAGTVKSRIERSDGLAEAVRQDMLDILRESFYGLFQQTKAAPWEAEGVLWTTQQGLDSRQARFKELTEVKMLENSRAIGTAAEHGDLSENAEWKFAIEERGRLQGQAVRLQQDLAIACVIRPEDVPTESVGIGSRVRLRHAGQGREVELTFLGPWDTDVERRVQSYKTPTAQALMGKSVGQKVCIKIDGDEEEWEIAGISSALG